MAIHLDISSKFSNQGKYLFRYLGQWHENLVLVIWNNWVVTFRENHIVWLRIQDTRISYLLIARNPRLKTQTVQNGIVLLVFLLLGVTRGLKDDIMSISITSAFNWVLSLLLTHNPHCHLHRHPHRHDHDDYPWHYLILWKKGSKLGHICGAEFAFQLVQRWPVLLASLEIKRLFQKISTKLGIGGRDNNCITTSMTMMMIRRRRRRMLPPGKCR